MPLQCSRVEVDCCFRTALISTRAFGLAGISARSPPKIIYFHYTEKILFWSSIPKMFYKVWNKIIDAPWCRLSLNVASKLLLICSGEWILSIIVYIPYRVRNTITKKMSGLLKTQVTGVLLIKVYLYPNNISLEHWRHNHWWSGVVLFSPKYRLGHYGNYLFPLSKKIFSGSKYPTNFFIVLKKEALVIS